MRCRGTGACTAGGDSSRGAGSAHGKGTRQVCCGMHALDAVARCVQAGQPRLTSSRASSHGQHTVRVPTLVLFSWHFSSALVSMGAIWW